MASLKSSTVALALVAAVALAFIVAALVFSGALPFIGGRIDSEDLGPAEFAFEPVAFSDLPGWAEDNQAEALPAFLISCARLEKQAAGDPANPLETLGPRARVATVSGVVADWRAPCASARALSGRSFADAEEAANAARAFFEAEFTPLRILAVRAPKAEARARRDVVETRGRFTGYFEPVYQASRAPSGERLAPVLARPADLVMVELGRFREALAGQRIAGYVEGGALRPYPDHKAINDGALGVRGRPLAYVDPDDLLFLQIQGSGRLRLDDGSEMRVGYDGQNGHPYFPVGRALIERGAVAREEMSMAAIRDWLAAAPDGEARALRELNPSYVFFRELTVDDPQLGPPGSEGVQLTPLRSLAVDRRYHAMGTPVWVALETEDGKPSLRRLFVAQDSGGAISGPIRGDIFFGAGAVAGEEAGALNAPGELYTLVPAAVAARLEQAPP